MASNTVINTNVLSLNATRNLGKVGNTLSQASARLSSGERINSAADDAAGLAISEKMRAQIRGLDQASRNAQDGQALANTAEGGMEQMTEMGQRMRELLVQASNDTNTSEDRQLIQDELDQLVQEFDSMSDRVQYNGKTLLDGSQSTASGITLQIGANTGQQISFSIAGMSAGALGLCSDTDTDAFFIDIASSTAGQISNAIAKVDDALNKISTERSKLGAISNRLDYTNNSLQISSENLSAAESRIRDADMAKEMMSYTQANVLQQAATSMLAQANQAPNNVLSLLG